MTKKNHKRRPKRPAQTLPRKECVVIGLGRFGRSVARTLYESGQNVLGIDKDPGRVQDMVKFTTHVVEADATNEEVLTSLGIGNFDIAIVSIGNRLEASVLVTLMLKDLGVRHVVAKAASETHGKVLERVGADRVIFPERDMGTRVARSLVAENVVDSIELTHEISVVEFEAGGVFIGQSLRDLDLRADYGVTIVAIRRGSEVMVSPSADALIREGDILVAIGTNENLERVESLAVESA